MSHRMTGLAALTALLLSASCSQNGSAPEGSVAAAGQPGAHDGPTLYRTLCATCHGLQGRGDGPAATYLFPKPRDFSLGKFKIRSTATGELPTDQDLHETLGRGMPGTAMPSFGYLPLADREALIEIVKSLAVRDAGDGKLVNLFQSRGKPSPVAIGAEKPCSPELILRGRGLYRSQGCAACHGETGVGDGPSAFSLRDDWGYPVPPNNFTRGLYKGGSTPRDIYLRFTTGMNGTPMPSFGGTLPDEDRWALVYYVKSLEKPGRPPIAKQASDVAIPVTRVPQAPKNPFDSLWDSVASVDLPLMHLWQRKEAADLLRVRMVHDGQKIAVLMEWEDARVDGLMLRPQDFPDASSVMFSLSDPAGHFSMGEKGKPCNLWQWRMDRQMDLAKFHDMEDYYTGMVSDDYPLAYGPKIHRPIDPASSHNPTFLTGKGAGNPASQTERTTAVQDLVANGFGTLEPQPPDQQNVQGRGVWATGKWRVIFIRDLLSPDRMDAQLRIGSRHPVAFAVWDGGAGDRDGQKSVTYWQTAVFDP